MAGECGAAVPPLAGRFEELAGRRRLRRRNGEALDTTVTIAPRDGGWVASVFEADSWRG